MHKMSHLGEKLYKCTLCDKFFSSRKSLDNHIKDHASDTEGGTNEDSPADASAAVHRDSEVFQDTDVEILSVSRQDPKYNTKSRKRKTSYVKNSPVDSNMKGRFYRTSDYGSDDNSRGLSPMTLTPPTSPNCHSTSPCPPYASSTTVTSDSDLQYDTLNNKNPTPSLDPRQSLKQNGNTINNHNPRHFPGSFSVPNSSLSFSSSINQMSDSFREELASVLTSHENGTCINFLYNHDTSESFSLPAFLKKELEARLAREELRRQRENIFCSNVVKVLNSLLGEERMLALGYPANNLDEIIQKTLEKMHSQPCIEPSLTYLDRVKVNLRLLLDCCVPDREMWNKFGWKGKSIEDIVNEFLQFC